MPDAIAIALKLGAIGSIALLCLMNYFFGI